MKTLLSLCTKDTNSATYIKRKQPKLCYFKPNFQVKKEITFFWVILTHGKKTDINWVKIKPL